MRVPTAALNRAVEEAMTARPPTSGIGRRARVYYLTQLAVHPPTIALFVNDPTMFDSAYQRYLLNRFRETLPFAEVPIKLVIRGKEDKQTEEKA
jgi:GTP-binding protein